MQGFYGFSDEKSIKADVRIESNLAAPAAGQMDLIRTSSLRTIAHVGVVSSNAARENPNVLGFCAHLSLVRPATFHAE